MKCHCRVDRLYLKAYSVEIARWKVLGDVGNYSIPLRGRCFMDAYRVRED